MSVLGPTPGSRPSADRLPLITKVAKLYHESNLRQPEIAERLNISQSRVSRLLKIASESGIVRTIVVSPAGLYADLEEQVAARFGLTDVVVCQPLADDDLSLLAALGSAAGGYLESTLGPSERVGISSWSASLLWTVNSMTPAVQNRLASEVVQAIGGVGRPEVQVQANHLADQLAHVTGGIPKFFPAPGIVASRAAHDALMADRYVGSLAAEWGQLTTLLAGIGTVEPSPLLASSGNAVDDAELEELRAVGAVGDVCLRFFDDDGAPVDTDLDARVLGIDASTLREIPRRIGIAGGARKFSAIRAAVRGGWINILVTDQVTAERLVDERSPTIPKDVSP